MFSPSADAMTRDEKRAGASLASIFALRMLGLFLILPVFSVHAKEIPGGDNLTLVGLAIGAYGLTQSMLQIAFGAASDRFGRKRVIIIGLVIFALGSFVAALAPDIYWVIAGRILQGAGAISAAVTALAADLTREQHRTKVMAMIGSSIGLVFALSLVIAPVLYEYVGLGGLFTMTGVLALAAILLVVYVVPEPPPPEHHDMGPIPFSQIALDPELLRLNFGIFTLHLAQMAAAEEIAKIQIRHTTIRQTAEQVIREIPVYRECRNDDLVRELLDAARENRDIPPGDRGVP